MKLVTISLKLAIDFENARTIETMIKYLNEKLQTDPQFFGNLKPDNIIDIEDICVHS